MHEELQFYLRNRVDLLVGNIKNPFSQYGNLFLSKPLSIKND